MKTTYLLTTAEEGSVASGVIATALAPFVDEWPKLIGWVIAALVLIIVDLRFGMQAARQRGEVVKRSRAVRRTINKAVDYLCWILLAYVIGRNFGDTFGIPTLSYIVLGIVYAVELESIYSNYFEAHGVHKRFNLFKFIASIFHSPAVEESIEDLDENGNPIPRRHHKHHDEEEQEEEQ